MKMHNHPSKQRYRATETGATLVELIYVLPLFFILLFGIVEMSYVYRSKATLNNATFEAARLGSLKNADRGEMRQALANGMMPLFVDGDKSVAGLGRAYVEARAFEASLNVAAIGDLDTVEIISPNLRVFQSFKRRIPVLDERRQRVSYVDAIPNDNLQFRETRTRRIRIGSQNLDINIQDANLLKIKTLWCHRLKVPGLRDLAYRTILRGFFGLGSSAEQRSCNALGAATGSVYVAITAHSIVRMQSPIYRGGLEN
ncbi:TadE/TadG family type IV pilus assembly protein [Arenicella xantha]|uniref:TadE-like protein n=1 Tax=Arenicella xantha TaxID=644221 RepID=A0A395JP77_9GAMM|nr:TadE/TadG family type IV pilus assembly protein [Arenicella xantha]RBP51374.1 TadE-like protein [Arenicella xantha]